MSSNRRSFLKLLGLSTASFTIGNVLGNIVPMLTSSPKELEEENPKSSTKEAMVTAVVYRKVIDLTHWLYHDCPCWATLPSMKIDQTYWAARDAFTLHEIKFHTHIGTHYDFPAHFIPEGKTQTDFPNPESFMGEAVVLNFQFMKPGEEIAASDLKKYAEHIKEGSIVLLDTGWSKKRGKNSDYLYFFPALSVDGAQYLADRKIKMVGTEGLSIAPWTSTVTMQGPVGRSSPIAVHRALLEKDILIVEELNNLEAVREGKDVGKCFFIALPLKIKDIEGCPARAIALLT
ncbi:MAG: cyclase family protein [Candidatus Methanomethylicia archaeon]